MNDRGTDYRSPITSLERELERLESELAALVALPPAAPRALPPRTKNEEKAARRELSSLKRQLVKLEAALAQRRAARAGNDD